MNIVDKMDETYRLYRKLNQSIALRKHFNLHDDGTITIPITKPSGVAMHELHLYTVDIMQGGTCHATIDFPELLSIIAPGKEIPRIPSHCAHTQTITSHKRIQRVINQLLD